MKLKKYEEYSSHVEVLFTKLSQELRLVLPDARIEHIGSSSIPESISKGDLDVFVGVDQVNFNDALEKIKKIGFVEKEGTFRSNVLCMLVTTKYDHDVAVQIVSNGSEFEDFLRFRNILRSSSDLVKEYNEVKLLAENLDENEYRKSKNDFITHVLIGFHDYPKNPEIVKSKLTQLIKESKNCNDIKKYVSLQGMIGVHQRSLMCLNEAEKTLENVLEIISKGNLSIAVYAQNKIRMAHVYQWQKKFNKSNLAFEEIIDLCATNKEASQYLHFAYQHHGRNLFDQKRYQEAYDNFEQALRIRKEINAPEDQWQSTRDAINVVKIFLQAN